MPRCRLASLGKKTNGERRNRTRPPKILRVLGPASLDECGYLVGPRFSDRVGGAGGRQIGDGHEDAEACSAP